MSIEPSEPRNLRPAHEDSTTQADTGLVDLLTDGQPAKRIFMNRRKLA